MTAYMMNANDLYISVSTCIQLKPMAFISVTVYTVDANDV